MVRPQDGAGLLDYLDHGGALLLVQPKFTNPQLVANFGQRTGIGLQGWGRTTPPFSVTTKHPDARILGLPEGRSVYPHRSNAFYLKLACENQAVMTRLSGCGEPDWVVSPKAKVAVVASAPVQDLLPYHRGDPVYVSYQQAVAYLLVNTVRQLLGYEMLPQPVQSPQQK